MIQESTRLLKSSLGFCFATAAPQGPACRRGAPAATGSHGDVWAAEGRRDDMWAAEGWRDGAVHFPLPGAVRLAAGVALQYCAAPSSLTQRPLHSSLG